MNNIDFGSLNLDLSTTYNSAQRIAADFERQAAILNEVGRERAERDAKIIAGAEASIAQKELLEQQLAEVKEQNRQLKENYRLLNELYESTKKEAQNNEKEARENKKFGWTSFWIGTLIGIAGIIVAILF